MMKWLTWAGGILAVIGTTLGGAIQVDERYAKAADVQQQGDEFRQLYLKSERREIQRQKFAIDLAKEQRKLTALETERAKQIEQEAQDIDAQLQQVEKKRQTVK